MPTKGRPTLRVRMHPEAIRLLKERAKREPGRKSGASELARRVLYDFIGFNSGEHDAAPEEATRPS